MSCLQSVACLPNTCVWCLDNSQIDAVEVSDVKDEDGDTKMEE